ncbi:sucrase ferredoxin [Nocardioides caldifontis]|uniref:sucrase ferredoxin n=1 Tax=Nocardioides caldifontis TaxID=2588938 RepID=UPI0011DF8FEE|nr:sucrase ferredoxin [Nocardioides caldifontis]
MTADPAPAYRCSGASRALGEPLEGTASTVRAFLLVEAPGPWGVDAVPDSRLPDEVKERLLSLERHNRVRPLLVRRPGRSAAGPVRVFAAYVHTDRPWTQSALLDDVTGVLDLELEGLGDGRSPGLPAWDQPLFAVCTHGRHDACCAERGRPLCAALAEAAPEHTWEVSHMGGDRFAGNVLVLPDGLYYGRLEPEDAAGFAARHLSGRLDLDHLRGRCAYPFFAQAAEVYLRRHLDIDTTAPFALVGLHRHATRSDAVFEVDGERWRVRVHTDLGERRQLTCRAAAGSVGQSHRLVAITRA